MKKLLNVSLIALSLVALFATAGLANENTADEYEFTALYNDVVVDFPSPISPEECSVYASLQNRVDQATNILQYDTVANATTCSHPDQAAEMAAQNVNRILEEISFDG